MNDRCDIARKRKRAHRMVGFCGLVSLMLVVAAGCPRDGEIDDPIVATYTNGTVAASELDRWLAAHDLPDPPDELLPQLEELVLAKFLAESAITEGLADDPKIAHRLDDAEETTLERALKRHTSALIRVSAEDVDAIAKSNPDGFNKPRRVRLRNIFKRFPTEGGEPDRARIRRRMEAIHQQLVAGADMADLALAESDSETRYRGGLMGRFEEDQLPPDLAAVVMDLAEGEITDIIAVRDGLTIIRCDAVFPATSPTADERRAKIETNILRNRRRQAIADLEAELLAAADLSISMDLALDPTTDSDQTIATIGHREITSARLRDLPAARRTAGGRGRPLDETQIRTILESYAVTTAAAARARELNLIDDELRSTVRRHQQEILATEELSRRINLRMVVLTDSEIEEYYEANREDFRSQPETDLEMIRFPFTPESIQDANLQARQVLDAIRSNRSDLREAARRHPTDIDGRGEYSTPTLTPRHLAGYGPAVGRAVQSLGIGETSGLIRQDNDFWVIKMVARRPPRQLEFGEARDHARKRLGQQQIDEIRAIIENELLSDLEVELVID